MTSNGHDPRDTDTPRVLHTGEGKVLVPLTLDQLEELAICTCGRAREYLLTAMALVDADRAAALKAVLL